MQRSQFRNENEIFCPQSKRMPAEIFRECFHYKEIAIARPLQYVHRETLPLCPPLPARREYGITVGAGRFLPIIKIQEEGEEVREVFACVFL